MREKRSCIKWKNLSSIMLVAFLLINITATVPVTASPALNVTVSTDKNEYYLKQNVNIYGDLNLDGQPIQDGLVAVEIVKQDGSYLAFRTLSTGTTPTDSWKVKILYVTSCDDNLNLKNEFKRGDSFIVNVTVRNYDPYEKPVLITVSVYDAVQIPMDVKTIKIQVAGQSTAYYYPTIWIPTWASIGNATIYANVYNDYPHNRLEGGTPYSPEVSKTFQITWSGKALSAGVQSSQNSALERTLQTDGSYNTTVRIPPEPIAGQCEIYVSSHYVTDYAFQQKSFKVLSAASPPQASFTWDPPEPYVNMTVTFDASSSTPDGGEIVNYTWNFGDNTQIVTETDPITTHKYTKSGTYTVTLNVTDTEGKWGATMKPINILPPTGPTARFGWTPAKPNVNKTVTFDARASSPGWNGTHQAPIVRYTWNFGDGNITTVTVPTIIHVFKAIGNYTVSLNVTDTEGLWSFTSQKVEVTKEPSLGPWDINGDGVVNIADIVIIAIHFGGATVDDPETGWDETQLWDPIADLNGDGVINIADITIVAIHFGETL